MDRETRAWARRAAIGLAIGVLAGGCDRGDAAARPDVKAAATRKAEQQKAGPDAPSPAMPGRVWFVTPKDGATVGRRFEVEFGVEGKEIVPAAGTVRDPKTGHHHIIIDGGPLPDMMVVPKDEKNLHYGDGATKTVLMLPPGKHTLTMQFADGAHQSYGPDWAATIEVDVQDQPAAPVDGG